MATVLFWVNEVGHESLVILSPKLYMETVFLDKNLAKLGIAWNVLDIVIFPVWLFCMSTDSVGGLCGRGFILANRKKEIVFIVEVE